ncbi:MAG TPA: ClbS/DfsB family four-helix bundle protein, partial [Epsilonproteobacteria bacterium]|nr:ClbS/DfsB family four-helix bundle protein [Campylobacterota bacterium]
MPRPKNKEELLSLAKENFEKLYALIDSFTVEQKEAEYLFDNHRDKNIRDIVMHLHQWHLMMLEWYAVGMRGEKP